MIANGAGLFNNIYSLPTTYKKDTSDLKMPQVMKTDERQDLHRDHT